ncbi:nucleotide exchange factor GrpE [Synechocystis sp. PCC 7509]|uniref:nucleotide exchange factor GrpE n=1 Tax=Synechocystis sp. PCC 7509 TaxID=927677 RepID=UPI001D0D1E32|nr:nucleotide exchange factor GrpE [Synechocystis sp. PCC 7509]
MTEPLENSKVTMETTPAKMNSNFDANSEENPQVVESANLSREEIPLDENTVASASENNGNYQQALAQKEQEVEALKTQVEERTSQYLRIVADFDNFRKRSQKEKDELEQQIKGNTITEMLPVVDNFERARSQLKPQTDAEMNIHKSYQSVYKQLVDCLKRLGVAPMRPEGKEFDPSLHEAVMRAPSAEPEGTILEELVRGYFLGDRILRHAMVKVAAPIESVVTSEENSATSPEES